MGLKGWFGLGAAAGGAIGGMNSAEAGTKHHEKMEDRPAIVEKHEAVGIQGAIKFALDKANEGCDEMTGTIEEGPYTVLFERKEGKLVAHVSFKEGEKTETKNLLIGEKKTGTDKNGNDTFEKVVMGDADELDMMAKLRGDVKNMAAPDKDTKGAVASEE